MRTIVLGIGAQKAATTWLFNQIQKSDHFKRGLVKEYHLFDVMHLGVQSDGVSDLTRRLNNYTSPNDGDLQKKIELYQSFYSDEKNYFDYLTSLLEQDDDFTSDITPVYSGLSAEVFKKIKHEFNQRGVTVKVIFILREPITRLESALRMGKKRGNILQKISHVEMTKGMYLMLESDSERSRGNYSYTCSQIDQVFTDEEVYYGFYETLFTESEINRLGDFLNIKPDIFDISSVFNANRKPFKYHSTDIERFKAMVEYRYQFALERFSFDLSIWDNAVKKITL